MPTSHTSAPPEPSVCPACSAGLTTDVRYPAWCPGCEWNLSPVVVPATDLSESQRQAAAREWEAQADRLALARQRAEQVYGAVAAGAGPREDRTWIAAMVMAAIVHLVTAGLLVGSVALQFVDSWPLRVAGWLGLAFAFFLRPRFAGIPDSGSVLRRTDAPALYALADRVAAAVGSRPVDMIRVTDEFNASFNRVGLRRRSVLTLGLPLWEPLGDGQRLALLAHELGHDVNGDHRSGWWLGSAITTLTQWWYVTEPAGREEHGGVLASLVEVVANLAMAGVNWLIGLLLGVLERLSSRSGQGAEYRADAIAARIASTSETERLLRTLLLSGSAATVRARLRSLSGVRRSSHSAGVAGFWASFTAELAAVPAHETERLLRLSVRELSSVDSTHPPTYLRIRMLGHRPVPAPALVVAPEEAAAIEAELAPLRLRIARELLA
ncbi:M48 family metallopeptidase [Kitasatospora sp. NBC_00240]|uniref:M48 family metallopeptidase n=1 Tax=Kitasatospora sp. NBC_00240 TaxID=2903567 RepID=UPI0022539A2F|nr:M48 family metallopeptidase [Kitasatospora sp. NBC_00240]MCX5210230.1 M48 family metallopeptidase [Kitasatospora sp. NBC_00240]